jgi:hypothetical protein
MNECDGMFLVKCMIPSQRRFNDIFRKNNTMCNLNDRKKHIYKQTENDMGNA